MERSLISNLSHPSQARLHTKVSLMHSLDQFFLAVMILLPLSTGWRAHHDVLRMVLSPTAIEFYQLVTLKGYVA